MSPVRKAVLLGAGTIGIDWLTKFFAVKKNISSLVLNPDLPFGIDLGSASLNWLATFILFAAFVFLISPLTLSPSPLKRGEGFALIVGGTISNLLDRLDGQVIDFIDIGISTLNFADFAIMGGMVLIAIQAIRIPNS